MHLGNRWQSYVGYAGLTVILLYIWWEYASQHLTPVLRWFGAVIPLVLIALIVVRLWMSQRDKPR